MEITKRDGRKVDFDKNKIKLAVLKAFLEVDGEETPYAKEKAREIANYVESLNKDLSVEEIQDIVVSKLMASARKDVAAHYIEYRYKRKLVRESNTTDKAIFELINGDSDYWNNENSNKNAKLVTTQRDYMAGIVSEDISKRFLLPSDVVQAHEEGIIHFHDIDYFGQNALHNCDLVNLEDMLQNGTVISGVMIEKPHSFSTACNIATQIIAQVASSQYGGQSISLAQLAPFVDISRKKIREEVENEVDFMLSSIPDDSGFKYQETVDKITEKRVREEVKRGVQTIQYQVVTLMTTNGQAPFITVFMYLNEVKDEQTKNDLAMIIEEVLKQRYQGVKNEKGIWVTPAFPKLIYVLEEDNVYENSKYFYLTKLAAKCTAKRLVPDYISEKIMKQLKVDSNGDSQCYTCMGCRSFLTPYVDENGKPKYYGRFNQGVVTINLPDVALSCNKDMNKFWSVFDERMELCHKALQCRHERLTGTKSDVAPILWQYGALARLNKGEKIDKLLHGGYSTLSLGYAGLYECVKYMR